MLKSGFKKVFGVLIVFLLGGLLNVFPCTFAEILPGDIPEDPILIKSSADLEVFSQDVLNGNSYLGKYVKLDNDIYLTKDELSGGKTIKWEPIGFASFSSHNKEKLVKTESFDGFFDGNGKTIYCNINGFYQSNDFYKASAIFGCLGKNGVIKNLNVEGTVKTNNIKISPAVICNVNLGIIENCNLNANVQNTKGVNGISFANYGIISNCKVSGIFETSDLNCSAVASLNYGTIKNCSVEATFLSGNIGGIDGDNNYKMPETAGISNFNNGEILGCHVKADIVSAKIKKSVDEGNNNIETIESFHGITGGIVSMNEGTVKDCSFSGNISSFCAGGIVGMNYKDIDSCKVSNAKIEGVIAGNFVGSDVVKIKGEPNCHNCDTEGLVSVIVKSHV